MPGKALGEEALSRVSEQDTRGRGCLPQVPCPGTRERASSPSAFPGTRGRIFVFLSFNGVGGVNRQVTCFFAECRSSPSVALGEEGLCRVLIFTECQDLGGTRESLSSPSATLGEDSLSRVPDFWHSGKPKTLGEFSLSRSVTFDSSSYTCRAHIPNRERWFLCSFLV